MSLTGIQAQILEAKRARLARLHTRPLEELREEALARRGKATPHLLRDAISQPDRLNVIAEIKRASPWPDVIQTDIEPAELDLS